MGVRCNQGRSRCRLYHSMRDMYKVVLPCNIRRLYTLHDELRSKFNFSGVVRNAFTYLNNMFSLTLLKITYLAAKLRGIINSKLISHFSPKGARESLLTVAPFRLKGYSDMFRTIRRGHRYVRSTKRVCHSKSQQT
jgi:hypothetical protein